MADERTTAKTAGDVASANTDEYDASAEIVAGEVHSDGVCIWHLRWFKGERGV
jgi:hypothetical protein